MHENVVKGTAGEIDNKGQKNDKGGREEQKA
jgi:hypothetical protein